MRVLNGLRRRYPRNRLVVLEAGATATRAKRAAEADALLTEGIGMLARDQRPRIPGEDALWHYKRGAARVLLRRREDARTDLKAAMSADAAAWVQGRAHVELARLAQEQGDRATMQREVDAAVGLCGRAKDPICVADAKSVR
jgi:hypothetical protein